MAPALPPGCAKFSTDLSASRISANNDGVGMVDKIAMANFVDWVQLDVVADWSTQMHDFIGGCLAGCFR